MVLKKNGRTERQFVGLSVTVLSCVKEEGSDSDYERYDITFKQEYLDFEGDRAKELMTVQSSKPVALGKGLLTITCGLRTSKAGKPYWYEGIDSFTAAVDSAATGSVPKVK